MCALVGSCLKQMETSESAVSSGKFPAPQQVRVGSSGQRARLSDAKRARGRQHRRWRCSRACKPSSPTNSGAEARSGSGSSGHFERPRWAERGSRLQFRAPQRCWVRAVNFERGSHAERARAADSSVPARPNGLEVGIIRRCSVFEQVCRAGPPVRSRSAQATIKKLSIR